MVLAQVKKRNEKDKLIFINIYPLLLANLFVQLAHLFWFVKHIHNISEVKALILSTHMLVRLLVLAPILGKNYICFPSYLLPTEMRLFTLKMHVLIDKIRSV